jgi:hypothetical protein
VSREALDDRASRDGKRSRVAELFPLYRDEIKAAASKRFDAGQTLDGNIIVRVMGADLGV